MPGLRINLFTMTTNKLTLKQYVEKPDVSGRINELLKDRAGDFIISLSSITNQNALLAKCDPQSLVMGALTATAMRLPINPNLGFCFMIPYKKKDGTYSAQLQLGYKAFVQLAMRSGQFKTINVSDVREGELKSRDRLSGEIKFEWVAEGREKLPVIGYVGYMALTNGFTKTLYMTVQELNTHSHKYSQTAKKGFGLWVEDFDSMAQKTVVKLLLSKYAPLTTDMQTAQLADQAVVKGELQYEYPDNDNTRLNPDEVASKKEDARVKNFILNCKSPEELKENCEFYCNELSDDSDLKKLYQKKLEELTK